MEWFLHELVVDYWGELEMQAQWYSASRLRKQTSQNRGGFTLLELMIVVVIISILIGLLVPAVVGVRRLARDAELRKEISDLEQAITQFKLAFNVEPPSQTTLYASAAAWDATPAGKRNKGLIKQMWPRFDFSN